MPASRIVHSTTSVLRTYTRTETWICFWTVVCVVTSLRCG